MSSIVMDDFVLPNVSLIYFCAADMNMETETQSERKRSLYHK